MAHRFSGPGLPYEGLTRPAVSGPQWTGEVRLVPEALGEPLRWRSPRLVFVNSMSDLFHEKVPETFIRAVFETMVEASQHRFQVLTKRSERLAALAPKLPWPENVWMGVSVEADRFTPRVDDLRATPAQVKFVSLEPLLSALPSLDLTGIDWAIVGGESGPSARPMKPEWVRAIRRACRSTGVAFFFKQWGGVLKGRAGRRLDGREYNEFPGEGRDERRRGVPVWREEAPKREL